MSEGKPVLKLVHEPCLGCVFAEYGPPEDGKETQVGCEVGRAEKFRELGMLVPATDASHNFFVVNGGRCNYRRAYPWGDGLTDFERVGRVVDESRVRVAAVLVDSGEPPEAVAASLDSLLGKRREGHLFDEVVVVNNRPRETLAEAMGRVEARRGHFGHPCVRLVQPREPVGLLAAVDEGVGHVREADWYVVVLPGSVANPSLAAYLNVLLNEELRRFKALSPPGGGLDGMAVSVAAHRRDQVGGNATMEFVPPAGEGPPQVLSLVTDKLRFIGKELENDHLVEELPERMRHGRVSS